MSGASPDARRRSEKLEAGVLDLSVRDLTDKDLPGVAQLVDVCGVHSLGLAHNAIASLAMAFPARLTFLDVSHNRLTTLRGVGLEALSGLKTLIASHNEIRTMQGLDPCLALERVDLSHNEIACAEPLPAHRSLYELDLSFNNIASVDDMRTLALSHMQCLHIRGNPFAMTAGGGGSNYRLVVSHMLPSVRVLDDKMQAPSPYVDRDSLSGSPARRGEAHDRATGDTVAVHLKATSLGKEYWAKKPNRVVPNGKKCLTYATIHRRRTAAANAAKASAAHAAAAYESTLRNNEAVNSADDEEGEVVAADVTQLGSPGGVPRGPGGRVLLSPSKSISRALSAAVTMTGGLDSSHGSSGGEAKRPSPRRVSPRKSQVWTGYASHGPPVDGRRSPEPTETQGGVASPRRRAHVSVAQQLSEAYRHKSQVARSGDREGKEEKEKEGFSGSIADGQDSEGTAATTTTAAGAAAAAATAAAAAAAAVAPPSAPAAVPANFPPTPADIERMDEEERLQQQGGEVTMVVAKETRARVRGGVGRGRGPGERKTRAGARGSDAAATKRSTPGSASIARKKNLAYAREKPRAMLRAQAAARPKPVQTRKTMAFGRSYEPDSRYSMNPSITPRTRHFASNLRQSGGGGAAAAAAAASGNSGSSQSKRKDNNGAANRRTPSSLTKMTRGGDSGGGAGGGGGGGSGRRGATARRVPSAADSELDQKKEMVRNVMSQRSGEVEDDEDVEEWNSILQALIDQKRQSLDLLYRSLSNETQAQTRMVNSQAQAEDVEARGHVSR